MSKRLDRSFLECRLIRFLSWRREEIDLYLKHGLAVLVALTCRGLITQKGKSDSNDIPMYNKFEMRFGYEP